MNFKMTKDQLQLMFVVLIALMLLILTVMVFDGRGDMSSTLKDNSKLLGAAMILAQVVVIVAAVWHRSGYKTIDITAVTSQIMELDSFQQIDDGFDKLPQPVRKAILAGNIGLQMFNSNMFHSEQIQSAIDLINELADIEPTVTEEVIATKDEKVAPIIQG